MLRAPIKLLYCCIFIFFTYFLFPPIAYADEYYFKDEFNQERNPNTLDSSRWEIFPNNNPGVTTIRETGGNFRTYQQNYTRRFPWVLSKNALPTEDFSAEIKFQYTKVTYWGTGIVLADHSPKETSYTGPVIYLGVWQDKSIPTMRIGVNGQEVYTTPINTNPHIFKVNRIGQKYILYLDGNLIFTTPDIPQQLKYIWMGNPGYQPILIPEWTRFNVDYVRVKALPPPKIPLIFIPGIGGSEFKTKSDIYWSQPDGHGGTFNQSYAAGEKVWDNEPEVMKPGEDDYFDILRLKYDGETDEAALELTGNLYPRFYQSAINLFITHGYRLNENLFVFPYDWRKDIILTSPLLDGKIEQIKQQTGSQKVDIVAHSMGGLVARNYIADSNKATKVRKLITLGTPHLGSVNYLKTLKYGSCLIFEAGPACFSLAPSEIKDVLQNMPGGYELAPTKKYFDFYSGEDNLHPYPFRDDRDIDNNGIIGSLTYDQTKTLLTNLGHNTSLFNPTENFHNLDNNFSNTNGVEVSIIAGSGIDTLGQIIEKNIFDFAGIKIPYKDMLKINGDETVPLLSASLSDPHKNLSLAGSAKVYYTSQKHGNLVFEGPAINLVKNILDNGNQIPTGVSLEPYKLKGHELSVHSPVNIHVYDQNNNHTGPTLNGDFETNIPGSSYDTLDDAKFIFLPDDGVYTIKFEATGQGHFDFKIRNYQADVNDKTILYKSVPLTTTTKAETIFDTSSTVPPILQLDSNGDGTPESQVISTSVLVGNETYDQVSPKTIINLTGEKGNNNWFKSDVTVTLNAEDESSGSGILKTEYSLDNGQTIQIYTVPFTVSQEGTNKLKFRSTDKAGNEEIPQEIEIKIDKTAPVINISANPNIIWPPNKKMVNMEILGNASDNISGISSKKFTFDDEYKTLNPVINDFNQMIQLEAWRQGNDLDGRQYRVGVVAEDQAGNKTEKNNVILVPHNQR